VRILEINIVIPNRIYAYLVDLVDQSNESENKILYSAIMDFVNQNLVTFNSIMANKEVIVPDKSIKIPIDKKLSVSTSILDGITIELKDKKDLIRGDDDTIVKVMLGDKLYKKYVDIIKLTYYINTNTGIEFNWGNINEFTAILVINSLMNKFNELEKKELKEEMDKELKKIDNIKVGDNE